MTQNLPVELPPISLARYFELLKRRRWQVIPMSIVGLAVGAVVAFLIPRYYVAQAMMTYRGASLDPDARTGKDPLQAVVGNARLEIPHYVPVALEQLNLIGSNVDDSLREETIESYRSRLSVSGLFAGESDRGYTNINVEYRDTDGGLSARFLNQVCKSWIEGVQSELRIDAERESQAATQVAAGKQRTLDLQRHDKAKHEEEHSLDPRNTGGLKGEQEIVNNEVHEAERLVRELGSQIRAQEQKIAQLEDELEHAPRRIEERTELPVDSNEVKDAQRKVLMLQTLLATHMTLHDSHPDKDTVTRQIEQQQAIVAALPAGLADGYRIVEKDNPARDKLVRDLRIERDLLERLRTEKEPHDLALIRFAQRLEELPGIYEAYDRKIAAITACELDLAHAREQEDERKRVLNIVRQQAPFRLNPASVPPTPTDPNIAIVALLGCIVGLGAAIGLVLLVDFLQPNFKTVEDVTYALRIPVLGYMTYLETVEERILARRYRRRVSMTAATFVLLLLSVVSVYYIDKTRLPLVVLEALDMILGGSQ